MPSRRVAKLPWLLLGLAGCGGMQPVWPKFHHDILQTGRSPFTTATNTGTLKWRLLTGGEVRSSPAIADDGTIYVGSGDGNLWAVDPTGMPKWKFPTGGAIDSSPAIGSDGTVYVGSSDGNLYAVNPNGMQKWKFPVATGAVLSSPVVVADGTIVIGSNNGNVYNVSATGAQNWKFTPPIPASVAGSPSVTVDGTIYVGTLSLEFYAIGPNGMPKWTFIRSGNSPGCSSSAVGSDGTIYVGCNDQNLYALNPVDGTKKWALPTGNIVVDASPAIGPDGTIYVGSKDQLVAADSTGSKKWAFAVPGAWFRASSPAVGADGAIYVGSEDGNLYAVNANNTPKWTFHTGGAIRSSPAISADGTVYVGSSDHYLYALGAGTPPGACCGTQQTVITTIGTDSLVKVASFLPFPFPAGMSLTVNSGPADPGCKHDAIVPPGGFNVPIFCIPALGMTVQMAAQGCNGAGALGSGAVWDASAQAPDPDVTRLADTSDPDGQTCATLGAGCNTAAGGAGTDRRGNINTVRGGSMLLGGKLHTRLDIPVSVRVWVAADGLCPDGDGAFDPGTDSLASFFAFMLSPTTGTTGADFTDLNADACSFAGGGGDHTRHCADDLTLPCSTDIQCGRCSVTTTRRCATGAGSGCPGGETCVAGACVDGPLSGVPATGPCCTVGQSATLVYTGVAFSGGAPVNDFLIGGRLQTVVTQCNAGPPLGFCAFSGSPCDD